MSFPTYPAHKDSGVEWLGQVPEHWSVAPIKYAVTCNDEVVRENTAADFLIEYLEISDVDLTVGVKGTTSLPFGVAPSRARRKIRDGDVVVSTVRTYLKAIAQIENAPSNLVASTGFAVLRPCNVHNSRFIGYAVQAESFIAEVISRSVGVSYPAINASDLISIKAALPPISEQVVIAAFLDRETVKIDALIHEQERLIELLNEKRQSVITRAVTTGLNPTVAMKSSGVDWLGQVPAHWNVDRICHLFKESGEAGDDTLPILSVSIHDGVSDKELADDEMERKVSRSEDKSKYTRVAPGDLVYNMMRAWQGGFGTVQVKGMVSPAYVVARPIVDIETAFVEYQLRTANAIAEMKSRSRGVTDFRLRLYWEEFRDIRVALPPKSEQQEILSRISLMNESFDDLSLEAESLIRFLNERRAALISAAVTGKIDVRGLHV